MKPYYKDDLVTLYLGSCVFQPDKPDEPVVDAWLQADVLGAFQRGLAPSRPFVALLMGNVSEPTEDISINSSKEGTQ